MCELERNLMVRDQVQWAWRSYTRRGLSAYLRGQSQIAPYSPLSQELRWLAEVAAQLETV